MNCISKMDISLSVSRLQVLHCLFSREREEHNWIGSDTHTCFNRIMDELWMKRGRMLPRFTSYIYSSRGYFQRTDFLRFSSLLSLLGEENKFLVSFVRDHPAKFYCWLWTLFLSFSLLLWEEDGYNRGGRISIYMRCVSFELVLNFLFKRMERSVFTRKVKSGNRWKEYTRANTLILFSNYCQCWGKRIELCERKFIRSGLRRRELNSLAGS